MNLEEHVSIIGLGKMGSAIAAMLLKKGYRVQGLDKVSPQRIPAAIEQASSLTELLDKDTPVLLAVKPYDVENVVSQITDDRLIISVAAGVTMKQLLSWRPSPGPVVRAMPNTPLLVRRGVTALYASENVSEEMRTWTRNLFGSGGESFFIEKEEWMHAITGLSGSGPAFAYLFLQALEDGGVLEGLPRDLSRMLALETLAGAAELVRRRKISPQDAVHEVTSPAGTTIRGVQALKEYGLEAAVMQAVSSAAERSRELAGE